MRVASNIPIPLPSKKQRKLIQADIAVELLEAVREESKKSKISIVQIVEWGLKAYLVSKNPKLAEKFGVPEK